jgi:hypothetical protein
VSFTIVRTNGTVLAIIPDGDLNTTSSPLFLPGRNYPGYGSVIDTNFVRTLENYAFTAPPQNALQGQLWFNTNNDSLCVCPIDGESDPNNWIRLVTNDSTLDITVANVYADHIFANGATFTNTVSANLVDTDYLTVNVQANIGNLDVSDTTTLDSLITANITTGSNTTPGNLTGAWSLDGTLNSNGNITALGFKSDNYRYANGQSINFNAAAGNAGEIQFNTGGSLNSNPDFTFNTLTGLNVVGNMSAVNFTAAFGGVYTGNASGLSAIPAANLSGTLSTTIQSNITQLGTLTNLTVTENINTANLFATEVSATRLVGSLTTAAQPNITSVGTLTSLNVTGNVTSGNANLGNLATANFITGTLITSSQPNITSVGTLSSLATTGNVTAGNVYANSGTVGAALLTGTVTTAAQPNITSVGALAGLTVTGNTLSGNVYANAGTVGAALLTGTLTTSAQPNITSVGTLTGLVVSGTVSASSVSGTLSGAGGNISNIQGSNVSGQVGFAAVANSVAVANVSGIGNVALLNRDGNASNVLYGNGIFAPYPPIVLDYGDSNVVTLLSSFGSNNISTTGNITAGRVTASLVAGTLTTAAQPNITSIGTLTGLIVSGNLNSANVSGNHFGNGAGLTNINGANVTGTVANATYATTAGSVTSIPSGTRMLFAQTSAPVGWTKQTTNDNAALRVVSGSASNGGSLGFTSAFTSRTVSGTTGTTVTGISLSTTDVRLENEQRQEAALRTAVISDPGHTHTFSTGLDMAVKYVDVIIAQKD